MLLVAGCGGSPTAPSDGSAGGSTGAVISGTVTRGQSGLVLSGLTAQVVGTGLTAPVADTGAFEIPGVPAGTARLQFRNDAINATTEVANVSLNQFITLQVQLNATSATIVDETRTEKVSLCHAEGNGQYHLIDISVSAEATHRAHGDGKIGDPVPGQANRTFDASCRPIGPSISIEKLTNDQDADDAPGPSITVGSPVTWKYVLTNDGNTSLTNVKVVDDKGVVVTCGQTTLAVAATMTCTGSGLVTAIGPYRNLGTVTANWANATGSGTVTDADPSNYLGITPIDIEKLTNGEEADFAPGPSVLIGSAVLWEYRLTNIGTVPLTAVAVTDDRGVAVSCPQATLAPGASITCTGSGVAVAGQYRNIGTVTANWSVGAVSGVVTDTDASHYLGVTEDDGPKVTLCHRTGAGFYVKITVGASAEPAHRAHGDAMVGEAVPDMPGRVFTANCGVQ